MPELVYNVKFQIDTNIREGVADIDAYKMRIGELEDEINNLNNAQNRQSKTQRTTNSQLSIGNQAFFSLSDAIQDSTQFSYGFSTGMRAVGNNIGFTAELLGNFVQKTKDANGGTASFNDVIGGLKDSFMGVGGFIFILNSVVTLVSLYGDEISNMINPQKKFNEELKKQAEELSKISTDYQAIASAIIDIRGKKAGFADINRLVEQTVLIGEDLDKINEEISRLEPIQAAQKEYKQLARIIQSGVATEEQYERYLQLSKQTVTLNTNTSRLNELYEKRAELNIQLAEAQAEISQAIQDGARVDKASQEEAIRLRRERLSLDIEIATLATITDLGKTELELFIEREEKKREEAKKTAKMRSFYEKFYLIEGQKVAQEYSSVWNAHYGITNEDSDDSSKKQIASTRAILDATGQFMSQLMMLNSQKSQQNEKEARKQFETNKKLAYASAVIAGSAAIVEVMRDTKAGLVGRLIASGIMAAAVGVQIAQIKQQQFGYGGDVGSTSGGSGQGGGFGFQMSNVQGPQTFRTPGFMPENQQMQPKFVINQELKADRRQLYILNKLGEEEYRQIKI